MTGRAILYVHPSDELYGSDRCLLEIVRGLPAGDRAIVVLPTDIAYSGALTRELEAAGGMVEHVDMLVLRRSLLRVRHIPTLLLRLASGTTSIARLVRKHDATMIHSNTVAVVCGATASFVTRIPHIWHVHEYIGDEPASYRIPMRIMLNVLPGRIVANSRPVAKAVIGGSQRLLARTRVVENGVDPEIRPADRSQRDTGNVVIGVVGRLSPRKGIAEAIEAAGLLAQKGKHFEVRFAGGEPPESGALRARYEAQVLTLGLTSNVTFLGEVERSGSVLDDFDILLLPSQRPEPFGLVVVEAMAAGLPVVATLNGGGSDDILDHGVTGLYCGRDPESIAEALELLIENPSMRATMGATASRVASDRYSQARYQSSIMRLYDACG